MSGFPVSYDYAVHSEYLIHWTGKDIDEKHQPGWYKDDRLHHRHGDDDYQHHHRAGGGADVGDHRAACCCRRSFCH